MNAPLERAGKMDNIKRCASCDIELNGLTVTVKGAQYCCNGCAQGGPCVCSYVHDSARYPRNGHSDRLGLDLYGGGN